LAFLESLDIDSIEYMRDINSSPNRYLEVKND